MTYRTLIFDGRDDEAHMDLIRTLTRLPALVTLRVERISSPPSKVDRAQVWLTGALAGGPQPIARTLAAAKQQGFGRDVVYEARKRMGLTMNSVKGVRVWALPGT